MRRQINPDGITPMGAYSQGLAVDLGDATLVVTSGQIAADAAGNPLAPGDLTLQTRIAFDNLAAVLAEVGATLQDLVKVQIFLTDMAHFPAVSAVRNEYLGEAKPASTLVEIAATVVEGCDIEIEGMAIMQKSESEA